MKVRTRFTLWFAGILFLALLVMGYLCYHELVSEPRAKAKSSQGDFKPPPLEDIVEFLVWCGVTPLALALAGGWFLIRKAFAPVAELTRAAEQLNERNLHQPLPRSGNGDELDRLTVVLNKMTEGLHQSFVRIHEFTLHASHELKTPLTVLHAELETALQDAQQSPAQKRSLESQLDEIQRLTKIVDGLNLLAKAGAGQVRLAPQPVSLDELVREALTDAQSLARPRRIDVELRECEPVILQADRHRLRQLLLNLCDNAVKYNDPNGRVILSLTRQKELAQLSVSNTGPGIPAEIQRRIFEPFFRGDPSHSSAVEGCGLGLSIAHWIVQAHGGNLSVASAPGGLTIFSVTLPIEPCQQGTNRPPAAESQPPGQDFQRRNQGEPTPVNLPA